jgi:hypothetical protein
MFYTVHLMWKLQYKLYIIVYAEIRWNVILNYSWKFLMVLMKYIHDWYLEYLCTNDHILMYLIHFWVVGHCLGPDMAIFFESLVSINTIIEAWEAKCSSKRKQMLCKIGNGIINICVLKCLHKCHTVDIANTRLTICVHNTHWNIKF